MCSTNHEKEQNSKPNLLNVLNHSLRDFDKFPYFIQELRIRCLEMMIQVKKTNHSINLAVAQILKVSCFQIDENRPSPWLERGRRANNSITTTIVIRSAPTFNYSFPRS